MYIGLTKEMLTLCSAALHTIIFAWVMSYFRNCQTVKTYILSKVKDIEKNINSSFGGYVTITLTSVYTQEVCKKCQPEFIFITHILKRVIF